MINKNSFIKIVNSLEEYWDKLAQFEEMIGNYITEGFLVDIVDGIIDGITEDVEYNLSDTEKFGPWLSYYAFELDFGKHNMAKDCVEIDGESYSLETAEQLYDLLVMLNEKGKNNE